MQSYYLTSSACTLSRFSHIRLSAIFRTVARQTPLSVGFSRQEYWSGLPFPSPGDIPDPGIEPRSPALQADALTSEPPGKPLRRNSKHWIYWAGIRCKICASWSPYALGYSFGRCASSVLSMLLLLPFSYHMGTLPKKAFRVVNSIPLIKGLQKVERWNLSLQEFILIGCHYFFYV